MSHTIIPHPDYELSVTCGCKPAQCVACINAHLRDILERYLHLPNGWTRCPKCRVPYHSIRMHTRPIVLFTDWVNQRFNLLFLLLSQVLTWIKLPKQAGHAERMAEFASVYAFPLFSITSIMIAWLGGEYALVALLGLSIRYLVIRSGRLKLDYIAGARFAPISNHSSIEWCVPRADLTSELKHQLDLVTVMAILLFSSCLIIGRLVLDSPSFYVEFITAIGSTFMRIPY